MVNGGGADQNSAYQTVRQAFARADYYSRGFVTYPEWCGSIRALNMDPMDEATRRHWFQRYDVRGTGQFDYVLFAQCLFKMAQLPRRDPTVAGALAKLRQVLLARAEKSQASGGPTGVRALALEFRAMARARTGQSVQSAVAHSTILGPSASATIAATGASATLLSATNKAATPVVHSFYAQQRKASTVGGSAYSSTGLATANGLTRGSSDDDKPVQLTKEDLSAGLARLGVPVTADVLDKVFVILDRDGSGLISANEFIGALRGAPLNDRRHELVELAFRQIDKNGNGSATLDEIAAVYDAAAHPSVINGTMTEQQVLEQFMAQWDTDHSGGGITLGDFLEYYKDLGASIEDDDYFELMVRNAWHLAGGKGVSANTANLRVLVTFNNGRQQVVCVENDLGVSRNPAAIAVQLEKEGLKDIKTVSLRF
jgi:Ca2+-binding EF-hand superfamily protein